MRSFNYTDVEVIQKRRDAAHAIKPHCPSCATKQVELLTTSETESRWKCRYCSNKWTLPTNHGTNMKTKLIALVGIPASGKTTWRQNQPVRGRLTASRDDIRSIKFGPDYKFSKGREREVTEANDSLIDLGIVDDRYTTVIVDETFCNLTRVKAFIQKWSDVADIEFVVMEDSFDVDLCHKRNVRRSRTVPHDVIERMHIGFLEVIRSGLIGYEIPAWLPAEVPAHDPAKRDCYLVDIDGTIADHVGLRSPFAWHDVGLDRPKQHVIDVISRSCWANNGAVLIVMSGRDSVCRPETANWLRDNFCQYDGLFMRAEGDSRKDYIVKMELYLNHIRGKYNVIGVFDDRKQVVRYWRRAIGATVFQVEDGEF